MQPWYTSPAALAAIASITERPAIVWEDDMLGGGLIADYAAPDNLVALHTDAVRAIYAAPVFDNAAAEKALTATPQQVLCALFGPSGGFYHADDFGALWSTIRDDIAAANLQVAA